MADYGHDKTEELLAELERKIKAVYKDAKSDLQATISEYFEQFKKRDAHQQELLRQGKITDSEYKQWRLAQMGRGNRFKAMRDHVAERITKANEVANAYVNDATPGIYSLNRNYAAYTIEQSWGNIGYTLYDEATVKRLIVEEPDLLPYYPENRAVRRGIDLAYGKKSVTATVTRGILQGSSIPRMAKDLEARITTMNHASAVRAARTAATSAQNGGRQDSYIAAKKMGIDVRKRWIATKDGRTRHEHGYADGQIVKADAPFDVGGFKMMFPGDKSAPGFLVYNCRCTMATVEKPGIEAEPRKIRVRDPATGRNVLINEMTYSEWHEWKQTLITERLKLETNEILGYIEGVSEYLAKTVAETYSDAKLGIRHGGTYKDAIKKRKANLEKSIKSHATQVVNHTGKINNPASGDAGWHQKTEKAQRGLLRKWEKDRQRNAEQAAVEIQVWKERFGYDK